MADIIRRLPRDSKVDILAPRMWQRVGARRRAPSSLQRLLHDGEQRLGDVGVLRAHGALVHARALVGELGLNSVVFLGPVPREKHAQLWGECAFSVIPSICHDVFPLALLESWMNGRAVVASRLGGCGEIIDQRRDGLLVEPYSVDSLAQGLQEMIDDPDGVAAMGEGGRRRVLTEFSRDVWLSNVRRVLDGVIHSAPAHA